MANSRFGRSKEILDSTAAVHPYSLPGLQTCRKIIYADEKIPKQFPYYKNYPELKPGDADATYSIARPMQDRVTRQRPGNGWVLQDKGFRYYWVLLNDESLEGYREQQSGKKSTGDMSWIRIDLLLRKEIGTLIEQIKRINADYCCKATSLAPLREIIFATHGILRQITIA